MFKVEIVAVGKLSAEFLKQGCAEYIKRTSPYYDVSIVELAEEKPRGDSPADERRIVEAEGERILKHLEKSKLYTIALCVECATIDSKALAETFGELANSRPGVCFIIGGSLGLADDVKRAADKRLSLSALTLPHQLARLVLLEQVYRAAAINNNVKYHK